MPTFIVCSGMGDISWVFSKFDFYSRRREVKFRIVRDHLKRSQRFVEMHPRIKFDGYCEWNTNQLLKSGIPFNTNLDNLYDNQVYPIECNTWLERGNRLENWLPEEPTVWNYDLNIKDSERLSEKPQGVRIGVYTSSYSTTRNWGFWNENKWIDFVKKLNATIPNSIFYLIGASFDTDLGRNVRKLFITNKINFVECMGRSLDTAFNTIKNLDYFFSFPSGLGIMANNFRIPTMMFMPDHLHKMKYKFTQLKDNINGFFINPGFIEPDEAISMFEKIGKKHMEERIYLRNPKT